MRFMTASAARLPSPARPAILGGMDEQTRFENQQRRTTLAAAWGCAVLVAVALIVFTVLAVSTFVELSQAS